MICIIQAFLLLVSKLYFWSDMFKCVAVAGSDDMLCPGSNPKHFYFYKKAAMTGRGQGLLALALNK